MIKHIVFDIGNVLMTFAPETYFIRWFQSEEKTHRVCSRIFTHEAWEKYDQGICMRYITMHIRIWLRIRISYYRTGCS